MTYKKLALAVAITAIPTAGFSMEMLDDAVLGDVTGQDGIELALNISAAGIATNVYLHDTDGLNSNASTMFTSYSYDGAIVITGMNVGVGAAKTITINVDAGDSSTAAVLPVLNVQVVLPATLTIVTGNISVANSQRDNTAGDSWSYAGASATILSTMTIVLGNTSLNINLGGEVQTGNVAGVDMINISAVITGGLLINSFSLNDANSSGSIGATSITVTDTGGANLNLALDANVTLAGLVVTLDGVGGATGVTTNVTQSYLGTTTAGIIGDISIVGLDLNGATLTISGK